MGFIIDEQTRNELALTSLHQPDTIYYLFNRVQSKKGVSVLENILAFPLEISEKINERTAILKHFEAADYKFTVDADALERFAEWMEEPLSRNPLGVWSSLTVSRFLSMTLNNETYNHQLNGLSAAITVLKQVDDFLGSSGFSNPGLPSLPGSFLNEVKSVENTVKAECLTAILNADGLRDGNMEFKRFVQFTNLLKNKMGEQINKLINFIAFLDVYIAVGCVAKENDFCYAVASESDDIICKIVDLRHPLLKDAISNTIEFGEQNLLFLTGANMAGKSTLMKSAGIAVYLAHCGLPVAAAGMSFSILDGLYTSINVPDNIGLGYSHFYAEVLRVKTAAQRVSEGRRMFVIFDELFKGTNVKDAYEGTLEVIKAFCQYRDCLFIVSTHIIEVAEALAKNENILFSYMPTVMDGNVPRYTYMLTDGVSEDRQGMLIIQKEGIFELLD